ncbi:GroES-like protein [Aspergillus sclerotioniger CBS 115572]|uniref:GroES-like protein n=1 Tax=Aspergillus sclerotioniger CBS 115572 TaxID=1450535 RepID=A0A317WD97_9EURO|nr:GroES-like protein [Aspergillus sclerotioniger CBS 115572]PWY83905.1 GroES-like protein [Aspergillus sclerotioniger CBS 115572]
MDNKKQEALVASGMGRYLLSQDVPVPTVKPDTILCRVVAVALNPADWKMVDFSATPGAVGGNDFAGEVIEVGEEVTRFHKGDRVFAMTFGLNPNGKHTGAFGRYALATADLACKVPMGISWEEAASLGLAIGTAGTALYHALRLPMPDSPAKQPHYVLISGGATATGTVAIQLLKASGLTPIVTCSPNHRELVLSLGAEEAFDYQSATCATEIRNYTNNTLEHVLDCVTEAASMTLCYEAIGSAGGHYIALDPFPTHIQYTRRDIKAEWLMIYSLFGEPVKLDGVYGRPARPQDRDFAAKLFPLVEGLLHEGRLQPHPIEIRHGGLGAIERGIEELRKGQVRGKKLAYPLA